MLMKLRAKCKSQKGFTLIELLVVISIIGVLAAVAVPKFMSATARANTAKIGADLATLDSAITMNQAMQGGDPASIAVLKTNGYIAAEPVPPTGKVSLKGAAGTPITDTAYALTTVNGVLRATLDGKTADEYN